jgi:branched-chain amino acid aminotransferase
MNLDIKPNIDWDSLGFNVTETKSMFSCTCALGEKWSGGNLIPYNDISLSPFAGVLNYGQGVFEGVKAFRSSKGNVVLFRADMNGKRMAFSTRRICMPEMDPDYFLDAVIKTVKDNIDYVPPYGLGSLYIRPVVWGTAPILGVSPTSEYTFMVIVSPVGPYFKGGIKPLNLKVSTDYHRAAPKGIGNAKAIGNYSASLFSLMEAKAEGFDENIYLDAKDEKFVEELGSANVFIYKDGVLKTPALNGSILGGITRQSVCQVASDILGIKVKETEITVDDLLSAEEVFCTGTAVVVTPIGKITYQEKTTEINQNQMGSIAKKIREMLVGIQREEIEDPFGWVLRLS